MLKAPLICKIFRVLNTQKGRAISQNISIVKNISDVKCNTG